MDQRPARSALELGAALRDARTRKGWTQARVAEAAGVSRQLVVDIERGKRPGTELSRVLAIARALGLGLIHRGGVAWGQRAGVIARTGPRLTFTYNPAYLAGANPTPLSLSMPLATQPYANRFVEAHLRGLLPDHADVRARWASHFGLRDHDTFGLVRAIGADTAGGAMYVTAHQVRDAVAGVGEYEPYSEAEIADRLRRLRADDSDWLDDDEHWSLAGGQGKFAIARDAGGWARPTGFAPSTHIVKPGISRLPAQALTEHVCQDTLRRAGLKAAESAYVEFEDQPAIVVTRFDRYTDAAGRTVRLHQEDMCQAFALDPSKKYPSDGGPSVPQIARLLRDVDTPSAGRFARAVIANYLLGAPDAHAKNYSVLLAGRRVELAPMYDVASGLVVNAAGRLRFGRAAMSIGGENRFGEVEARHWDKFATACGLPGEKVVGVVRELAGRLPDAMADAVRAVPATVQDRAVLTEQVHPRVRRLCDITVAGLDGTRRVDGRVVVPALEEVERVGTTGTASARARTGQGRQPRGVPSGGQGSSRGRDEPEVFLSGAN